MKKLLVILVISVMLVVTGSTLNAAGKSYISKHMQQGAKLAEKNLFRGNMLLRLKDELGLTPDQVGKIEQMNLAFQESMIRRMADTKVKELKLANYLQGDKLNRKTIEKMIVEIAKLKTDLQIDRIYYLLDIKEVLTPEQIKKIEKFRKSVRRRAFLKDRGGRESKDGRRSTRRPGIR